MAVTARGHRYRLAWGKQTAEGTPQATPLYEGSFYSGAIAPRSTVSPYEVSDTDDLPLGYFRERSDAAATLEVACEAEASLALWAWHLGGIAISGAGDPFTHTLTKSDTKPFTTVYGMRPDVVGGTDRWERLEDGFVRAIELRAEKGKPLRQYADIIGKTYTFNPSAPTPTNDRKIGAASTVSMDFKTAVLLFDIDATPAVSTVRSFENITIRSEYASAEWIQTDELTPRYLALGPYAVGVTVTAVFDSFGLFAATFLGSETVSASMALSQTILTGSLDATFTASPSNANRTLQVKLPSLLWAASLPELQPSGEAVRVNLSARIQKPASGQAIEVIGKNAKTTAY